MSSSQLLSDEGMGRVRRKKDFCNMERVDGRALNILQGLELHTNVFSPDEQSHIVATVLELQKRGRRGLLRERTYSEPRKWMRGKGRVTIQFGCCYNYAVDRDGNPPGIVRDEHVDPLPPLFAAMVRRLVLWRVLPLACVPDSCIVNIYDVDDCIPPHVDSHDFVRPFCTVSFLAECAIVFGRNLKVLGPGEFGGDGSTSIKLPVGSVLVLKGNGADVAKHCVPAVPAKRISITFRKMDNGKVPFGFRPDPLLQKLAPASLLPPPPVVRPSTMTTTTVTPPPNKTQDRGAGEQQSHQSAAPRTVTPQQQQSAAPKNQAVAAAFRAGQSPNAAGVPFSLSADEFPALGALPASGRRNGRR